MIDKQYQKDILQELRNNYPSESPHHEFAWYDSTDKESVNIHYLANHGLIEIERKHTAAMMPLYGRRNVQPKPKRGLAKITEAGMDYIDHQGGLTAELGTHTIRLHTDTIEDIRAILDAKIVDSDAIADSEKPGLRKALKNMKDESIKQLTTRMISSGIDQGTTTAQQLWQWLSC